jgi:hypothetical protein
MNDAILDSPTATGAETGREPNGPPDPLHPRRGAPFSIIGKGTAHEW